MASERQIAANRRNAQNSTGPRTAAGKARAADNARRHGLRTPIATDQVLAPQVEPLARAITAGDDRPAVMAWARLVAEAALEVERVRRARVALLDAAIASEEGPLDERIARATDRHLQDLIRFE